MERLRKSILDRLLAEKHQIPKHIFDAFQPLTDNEFPTALFMPNDTSINAEIKEEFYDTDETDQAEGTDEAEINSMDNINHNSYPYSDDLYYFNALSVLENEDTSEDISTDTLMDFSTSSEVPSSASLDILASLLCTLLQYTQFMCQEFHWLRGNFRRTRIYQSYTQTSSFLLALGRDSLSVFYIPPILPPRSFERGSLGSFWLRCYPRRWLILSSSMDFGC